jgi:hypothetical protein
VLLQKAAMLIKDQVKNFAKKLIEDAAVCKGGVYNAACVAGAYGVVVVRRGAAVVRAPVARRAVVIRR